MDRTSDSVGAISRGFRVFAQVALGLFIVAQLAFIGLANFGTVSLFLGNTGNPVARAAWRAIGTVTEPYAFVTGQEQYWRMFAPSVPPRAIFVRMILHMDDETVHVPSEFEAVDLHLPGSGERMWHVEKSIALPYIAYDRGAILAQPDEWRNYLAARLGHERHRFLAYLDWKTRRHLKAMGDTRRPVRVDLAVSIHTQSRHDQASVPEFEEPVLRWYPAREGDAALELCSRTPSGVECRPLMP